MRRLQRYLRAGRLFAAMLFRRSRAQWWESPAQEFGRQFMVYCQARRSSAWLQRFNLHLVEMMKHRELSNLAKTVFRLQLPKQPVQENRRDVVTWPYQIWQEFPYPTLYVHGIFELSKDVERPLDLCASVLSSSAYQNISFVWTETEPAYDAEDMLPFKDRDPAERDSITYGANRRLGSEELARFEHQGDQRIAGAVQSEAMRRVNDVLKVAAPQMFVVALALHEDDLGFCDKALSLWFPTLQRLHKKFPSVAFCLLTPTTLGTVSPEAMRGAGVIPLGSRGFDNLSAFAFPMRADAFVGVHNELGLVAVSHGKPGLFIDPQSGDYHDDARKQWFLKNPSQKTIESIITNIVDALAPAATTGSPQTGALKPVPASAAVAVKAGPGAAETPSNGGLKPSSALTDAQAVAAATEGWRSRVRRSRFYVPAKKRPTVTLYVDIFGYCNLRCPSCPVGNWPKDEEKAYTAGLMSEQTLRDILEKALAETKVSSVGLFNWTEPLLNPNVAHLVRVVRSYGLDCSISTNLNILKDPEDLLASGLNWLRISVSGYRQDIYERNHKRGDIEVVKKNMRRLARARDAVGATTDIEVFFHKYKDNEADEEPMREFAESLGFRFVSAWAYLMPVEKMLTLANPKKPYVTLTPEDDGLIERLALPPEKSIEIASKHEVNGCELYDFLTIGVSGDLFLCCASSGVPKNKLGNYLDLSMAEIRKKQKSHSLCGPCMKAGLPILYGHKDPAFDALGERERADFRSQSRAAMNAAE